MTLKPLRKSEHTVMGTRRRAQIEPLLYAAGVTGPICYYIGNKNMFSVFAPLVWCAIVQLMRKLANRVSRFR